jgi:hypothetical protein
MLPEWVGPQQIVTPSGIGSSLSFLEQESFLACWCLILLWPWCLVVVLAVHFPHMDVPCSNYVYSITFPYFTNAACRADLLADRF